MFVLILQVSGLRTMTRNHVHFATGEPGDGTVMSGARADANVLVYIDMRAALAAGIQFYLSTNGVILSRGIDGLIPARFFARVLQRLPGGGKAELPLDAVPDAPAAAGVCLVCIYV